MPEVEVGLMPIIGHVALAVLVGVEGAWVNVDIGVKLLDRDAVATCLKELPEGSCYDALPEGGHDASRHEDILCCLRTLLLCPLSTSDWLSATSSPLEEEAIASTRARLIRVILGLYRCHAK